MNLREALQAIYDENGRLTPALVVDAARAKNHPLHSRFDWDNRSAAESWRREQASQLIRSVKVVYHKADTEQRLEVRAFHAISGPDGNVYEPNEKVVADPLLRAMVLRDMERDWKQMKARYSDFEEFWSLIQGDLLAA